MKSVLLFCEIALCASLAVSKDYIVIIEKIEKLVSYLFADIKEPCWVGIDNRESNIHSCYT